MCPGTFSATENKCKISSCSTLWNFFICCTDHKLPAGIVPSLWNSHSVSQLMDSHRVGYPFSYTGGHIHSLLCSWIRDHGAHVVTLTNSKKWFHTETKPPCWRQSNPNRNPVLHVYTLYITATSFGVFCSVFLTTCTKLKAT